MSNDSKKSNSIYAKSQPAEDEDTIWLLSYADLMTLLFTFFVMLYSSVLGDNTENLRRALSSYIEGSGGGDVKSPTGKELVDQMRDYLSQRIIDENLVGDIKVGVVNRELVITFSSSLLFDLGSADLKPAAQTALHEVIHILKERASSMRIRVEGFTDDNPIATSRFQSNWELSGARAAHIVSLLEASGFPSDHLLIVGYGASRPIVPNRTVAGEPDRENQRLNRRVLLTVYQIQKKSDLSK